MRTGMSRATAGWIVAGCSTLAPKYASSDASANDRCGTTRGLVTTRGSAVSMPSTSVQIWISAASQAAADDGAGEVRAAAAERGRHAAPGRADEAADDRHLRRSEQRTHPGLERAVVSANCGAAAMCSSSVTMARARIHPGAGEPARGQRGGHDAAAEDLAGGGNRVEPARRDLAQHAERSRRRARVRRTRGRCQLAPRRARRRSAMTRSDRQVPTAQIAAGCAARPRCRRRRPRPPRRAADR